MLGFTVRSPSAPMPGPPPPRGSRPQPTFGERGCGRHPPTSAAHRGSRPSRTGPNPQADPDASKPRPPGPHHPDADNHRPGPARPAPRHRGHRPQPTFGQSGCGRPAPAALTRPTAAHHHTHNDPARSNEHAQPTDRGSQIPQKNAPAPDKPTPDPSQPATTGPFPRPSESPTSPKESLTESRLY